MNPESIRNANKQFQDSEMILFVPIMGNQTTLPEVDRLRMTLSSLPASHSILPISTSKQETLLERKPEKIHQVVQ